MAIAPLTIIAQELNYPPPRLNPYTYTLETHKGGTTLSCTFEDPHIIRITNPHATTTIDLQDPESIPKLKKAEKWYHLTK